MNHDVQPVDSGQVFRQALIFECGLGVVACAIGWWFERSLLNLFVLDLGGIGLGIAATMPLVGVIWPLIDLPWQPARRLRRLVQEHVAPMFAGLSWWRLALISLAAGWGEELLFRGLIQGVVAERLGTGWGIALASLFFGLLHALTAAYLLLAIAVGAYLGWLWVWSENLLAPALTHALYDFATLLYLRKRWFSASLVPPSDA